MKNFKDKETKQMLIIESEHENKTEFIQESRRVFANLKLNVKLGNKNIMPYLYGTRIKRTKMYKEVERYRNNAKIDYELGLITNDEYAIEIEASRMFEKALANYSIF